MYDVISTEANNKKENIQNDNANDPWSSTNYHIHASFVPSLVTTDLIALLSPQSHEKILDLGCGDGKLTVQIQNQCQMCIGIDKSANMVAAAKNNGCRDARVVDADRLGEWVESEGFVGMFDKVFSNAAIHWMKNTEAVIEAVRKCLKPGGKFVAEMGCSGNCQEIENALIASLNKRGFNGKELSPWKFLTPETYTQMLTKNAFNITCMQQIPRPTLLPTSLSGWIETFGFAFLKVLEQHHPEEIEAVKRECEEMCRPTAYNQETGKWVLMYVRLRFVAEATCGLRISNSHHRNLTIKIRLPQSIISPKKDERDKKTVKKIIHRRGYLVYLARGISSENPHIETSTTPMIQIPAPSFYVTSPIPFTANCNYVDSNKNVYKNGSTAPCNHLLSRNQVTMGWGNSVSSTNASNNSQVYLSQDGIFGITVQIYVNSSATKNQLTDAESAMNSGMVLRLVDADFGQIDLSSGKKESVNAREEAFNLENAYILSPYQRHVVWFRRIQYKDLDGHKFRNGAGINSVTNDYYAITSQIQTVSPQNPAAFKPYTTIEIYYQSRIVTTNEQIKDKTVMNLLSSIGGAFGLGMGIYAFCFGSAPIGPWGISQELPMVRRSLRRKLQSKFGDFVPLVDEFPNRNKFDNGQQRHEDMKTAAAAVATNNLSFVLDRIQTLERRSAALELLLRDYVVDIGDLEELIKSREKANNSSLNKR
ncbi:11158_t:CDS:10 [Ambispora leptoticha]|uniref:11158_t:CDS:1 n=1 Tax=Ambispora leptoticha TaxID=144679 RepID=A0A9N8ZY03_9GLOM|nr:11158_t:CDS:10 [Ambispora leptoticha]